MCSVGQQHVRSALANCVVAGSQRFVEQLLVTTVVAERRDSLKAFVLHVIAEGL